MIVSSIWMRWLAPIVIVLVAAASEPVLAQAPAVSSSERFSPAFLGMYRKLMEIDGAITRYSQKYGVDPLLARAVCMFESGGNGGLTSGAGARGYFQVMPSTFRLMHVPTNIEAGIKYLGQLIRQFGREDSALAAYNGGPGRVARGSAMPLESLQYVIGVGHYRSVLKQYEPAVRTQAAALQLVSSRRGDDWAALADRLNLPEVELRLYNPFLTDARLRRSGFLVAYPVEPATDLFELTDEGGRQYRSRIGDNYINLAVALGADLERLRSVNGLWRLQTLPVGMLLTIPSDADSDTSGASRTPEVVVASGPEVGAAAAPVRRAVDRPSYGVHRVRRGENLTSIARRYGTSVAALQRVNAMGRRTKITIGQRLRVPAE